MFESCCQYSVAQARDGIAAFLFPWPGQPLGHSIYQASGVHSISSLLAYLPYHHSRRGQKGGRKRGLLFFSCPSTILFCEKCITQIQGRPLVNGKHRDDGWMLGWMDRGREEGERGGRGQGGRGSSTKPLSYIFKLPQYWEGGTSLYVRFY